MQQIRFVQYLAVENGRKIDPGEVPHAVTCKVVGANNMEMTVTEYGYTSDRVVELSGAGMNQCLDKTRVVHARA